METFINNKYSQWLLSLWPLVILTPVIWFPQSSVLTGHPWKPELLLSVIIGIVIILGLIKNRELLFTFGSVPYINRAMFAFIIWSGISIFWAVSPNSPIHHSLVWTAYLLFFLLACFIAANDRLLRLSFYGFGIILSIVAANCVIETLLRPTLNETFGFRYGRYAEIWAAALPLFLSFAIRLKGNHRLLALAVTSLLWLGIFFSTSRGSLAAAVVGLGIFGVLRLLANRSIKDTKKLVLAAAGLFILAVLTQLPALLVPSETRTATIVRAATSSETDPHNSLAKNVRYLFWATGLEMAKAHPIIGVGADTYGLEFNNYKRVLALDPAKRPMIEKSENAMPERTHNEYLQIVAELGVIGGIIFLGFLVAVFYYGFLSIRRSVSSSENILIHAAFAGVVAFLMSSAYSSFSFRLVQNGVVFFFLLALMLRPLIKDKKEERSKTFSRVISFAGLICCVGLAVFSGLKATSQYMVYAGEHGPDIETTSRNYINAKALDNANASADFSYALLLFNSKQYEQAAKEFRLSIDKGVYTATVYSYEISAYSLAGENDEALRAAQDAVSVFPYSVFLHTRYAVLLEKEGRFEMANEHYQLAESIEPEQALTWRILIKDGARPAAQAGREGKGVPLLVELYPQDGMYAVLAERGIRFPEEKFEFPK